jgi:uncharacterized protein YhbP (UPF0306 family)
MKHARITPVHARVAQLDRALACGAKGRRFESYHAYHYFMKPKELLNSYLDQQHMMQLATVRDGRPWICTVYFVSDSSFNLYWASLPTRRHSKDIKNNPNVAAAIAVKFTKGEKVIGVQVEGTAEELSPLPEHGPIIERYAARFKRDKQWVKDFTTGNTEHRLYKLTPSLIFLFDEVNFPGGLRQKVIN